MDRKSQPTVEALVQTTDIPKSIWLEGGVLSKIETLTWGEYWTEAVSVSQFPENIQRDLAILNKSWLTFLHGKFNGVVAYCHAYFCLLHKVNQLDASLPSVQRMLHKVLGFEVVGIYHKGLQNLVGILTNRHPGYLLSRIKYKETPDDPKYIPLIVAPPFRQPLERMEAYYHYRQIKLAPFTASLLCYLPVETSRRIAGFECYHALNSATRCKADPRSEYRANYIADRAIKPF